VVAIYEAGWSGFWLARWLARHGVETHVVQPSSVPVDRRARRAKSDGIDAELLLRTVLTWLRGEPRVCAMVPIPDEADEDERRRVRERVSGTGRRMRKVMVVAMARRLLIALWRFATQGVVPGGAVMKPAY
jgi:transposase